MIIERFSYIRIIPMIGGIMIIITTMGITIMIGITLMTIIIIFIIMGISGGRSF